jgi:hypothetical protein
MVLKRHVNARFTRGGHPAGLSLNRRSHRPGRDPAIDQHRLPGPITASL